MFRKLFIQFLLFSLHFVTAWGKNVVYDNVEMDASSFFEKKNTCYVIRYKHVLSEEITIPEGCELLFKGGWLSGKFVFKETRLSGNVNLKGSSIAGTISNKRFDASWLCVMDGVVDDAPRINEMIDVCGSIYFPKGKYRLISAFDPTNRVSKELVSTIKTHIGICKSNVSLVGEPGTKFITDRHLITICLLSKPNEIENSIKNILIKNITFEVVNDGVSFYDLVHTIKTIGVNGLRIEKCTFDDFWGDAICLSHYGDTPQTGERTKNQNVKIINNCIIGGDHHNNRNGISVIGGKNVLIKGNVIKNTSRKDMPGGIDIEPNNSAYTVEDIIIKNNVFDGIKSGGGAISVASPEGGPAHRIFITGNRIYNSNTGFFIYLKSKNTTDTYIIKYNYVDGNTRPYRFEGKGGSRDWNISYNTFDRPCVQKIPGDIFVKNLRVEKNKKKE